MIGECQDVVEFTCDVAFAISSAGGFENEARYSRSSSASHPRVGSTRPFDDIARFARWFFVSRNAAELRRLV